MMKLWRAWWAAVGFLTRVPVPFPAKSAEEANDDLRRALIFFPVVGGLIGLATASVLLLALQCWPIWVAVLLALAFEAWMTGAFHEDAVADFCDAFGGGWNSDDIFRIMKDSRVGSFGTVGLVLALAIRATSTATVAIEQIVWIVPAASAFGRVVILFVRATCPSVADRAGLAHDISGRSGWVYALLGTILVLPLFTWLGIQHPERMLGALLTATLFVIWFVSYLRRRIGGVTGDCLGFSCYVGQLIFLLSAVAHG